MESIALSSNFTLEGTANESFTHSICTSAVAIMCSQKSRVSPSISASCNQQAKPMGWNYVDDIICSDSRPLKVIIHRWPRIKLPFKGLVFKEKLERLEREHHGTLGGGA